MSKVMEFEIKNEQAAAIDIGSRQIFVSWDGITTAVYESFTQGYQACIADLKQYGVKKVCMEATGVYWIALHHMLEKAGFDVCLVNPKEVKQVQGRKTDVSDTCWMYQMFSAGLVRRSYVPKDLLKELRMLIREREDIISMGSSYINKMQKALELMNIKLTEVISQINGVSGLRIIEAIIAGERDAHKLLSLCHRSIIENKAEQIIKALEGDYNETWLFLLEQNLKLWRYHEQQLGIIDARIEKILELLQQDKQTVEITRKPKAIRHHAPKIKNLHQTLLNIYGVDANCIPGITNYSLLKLLAEVGTDMSRFPTVKHFVSWCGLAPGHNQSGTKHKKSKYKNRSNTGQVFREMAWGMINSKHIAIGAFIRRLRGRKDAAVAIKAGARKIAEAFYNLLTKGVDYVEQGARKYEQQLKEKQRSYLEKMAKQHGLALVDIQAVA